MELNFTKNNGLIPAIIQDAKTKTVLMLGYMNAQAFAKTQESGQAWFWSRRRKQLWQKGENSGNTLVVQKILMDCDADTLLILVTPTGPTCHTGEITCFTKV
jgi:phosphoribosyl-AMP cyclohydrolase / phosphoribosyl-ATP pyrophosphohydrolase